jgi:hypothetical protein
VSPPVHDHHHDLVHGLDLVMMQKVVKVGVDVLAAVGVGVIMDGIVDWIVALSRTNSWGWNGRI